MKLSVKAKVANGLVICLLLPRVADTAIAVLDVKEGLDSFSADDDFDFSPKPGSFAIAKVDTSEPAADPSGGDPSGGNPIGCDPSGVPQVNVLAPATLVTTEDGSTDSFEVFMDPPSANTQYLYFTTSEEVGWDPSGGDPSGGAPVAAVPIPKKIAIEAGSCDPHRVWVRGQNDGAVDGDAQFTIEVRDEYNALYGTVSGINFDNDNIPSVTVEISGPESLADGQEGQFTVRVANVSDSDLIDNRLEVEASSGVTILSYAASLISGGTFNSTGRITPAVLMFDDVELPAQDVLILSVNTLLSHGSPGGEQITARFSNGQQINDDDEIVHIAQP
jgi:hypothetical protein